MIAHDDARPFSFLASRYDTHPVVRELTWRDLCNLSHEASKPPHFTGPKDTLALWSPAELVGGTKLQHVASLSCLVFDVDGSPMPRADVVAGLPIECIAHASYSNGPELEKMRLVVRTSRPHTAAEHGPLWRFVAGVLAGRGVEVDQAARDASRRYYVPANRPRYGVSWNGGQEPLEVDRALACMASAERESEAGQPLASHARVANIRTGGADAVERASRYLAAVDAAVSGQGGHGALWRAALAMVRGFELSPAQALGLLLAEYNPRCQPPWHPRDVERKVSEATQASSQSGYLLERGVAA